MDKSTLARVVEILETDPDFYVAVKKMWLTLQEEGLARDLDLGTFHGQLEADGRFEFMEGVERPEDFEDDPAFAAEMQREMESLGLFSGPRVKLATREMTAEDVFAGLSRSLEQLNAALRGAWEVRPEENAEAEDLLRDALAMSEQLEREVQEMIEKHGQQPINEGEVT
jgi:hypothetical protein